MEVRVGRSGFGVFLLIRRVIFFLPSNNFHGPWISNSAHLSAGDMVVGVCLTVCFWCNRKHREYWCNSNHNPKLRRTQRPILIYLKEMYESLVVFITIDSVTFQYDSFVPDYES